MREERREEIREKREEKTGLVGWYVGGSSGDLWIGGGYDCSVELEQLREQHVGPGCVFRARQSPMQTSITLSWQPGAR